MKELIKRIRLLAKMSQEQFASTLGTTVASINRWENGKVVPNNMAQRQIYNFCIANKINLINVIESIKESHNISDNLILYHGSKKGIEGEIKPVSRERCDFGSGFYMGTNTLQPLTLVCNEDEPMFYVLEFDLSCLKVLNVEIGLDWALLIAYYRNEMEIAKGTEIYNKYANMTKRYDVIVGHIADDRMYTELTRFFHGDLTDVALINCLSALDLGKQYVAISEKACKQIKIIKEEKISLLELLILRNISEIRRQKSIEMTHEIEIKYRREGKYFDEILRGER